jgi:hypothetical protein
MHAEGKHKASFKVTYINSKWIYPIALFISVVFIGYYDSSILIEYLGLHDGLNFYNIRDVLPHYFFVFLCLYLLYYAVSKNASFIPMLALLTCSYLLSESGARNWERFILWLLIGIVIYFFYGKNRSKLA